VIEWVKKLCNRIAVFEHVLILSGRSSVVREKTHTWLNDNGIKYDFLEMRKDGDNRPDQIIKYEMLNEFLLANRQFHVEFIVDDRQRVVDMWREKGFNVLQCNAWVEK